MMYEMFPLMQTMYHQEATTATECQDLLGMSFRTVHFDGFGARPVLSGVGHGVRHACAPTAITDACCDFLQWHCPPRLWHLKTPVHMFALDALIEAYPDARFLWSHRDPAKVLGSVCSLIQYTRSWSSDRDDSMELGTEQLGTGGRLCREPWSSGGEWATTVSPTSRSPTSRWTQSARSRRRYAAIGDRVLDALARRGDRLGRRPPAGLARAALLRAVATSGSRPTRFGAVRALSGDIRCHRLITTR